MNSTTSKEISAHLGDYRWDGVELTEYKTDGTHFRDITRQVLFDSPNLNCQLRYFEVQPGGYSTLERHEHVHAVLILRGQGTIILGDEARPINHLDMVYIPPMTWHQLHANQGDHLGFLCLVNCERDLPQRPTEEELAVMRENEAVAELLRV